MLLAAMPAPPGGAAAPLKVRVSHRVIAKFIDIGLIVAMAGVLPYPLGPILGFLYSLLSDAMNFSSFLGTFRGQSLGKKIMRLQVVSTKTRAPAQARDSLYRNTPVGVITFFAIIPVWGWIIFFLLGIPLFLMEVYLMSSVAAGHRLGDVMGDTEVVELPKRLREISDL
jgi:uncharacterized RDD family membrane protein YckC